MEDFTYVHDTYVNKHVIVVLKGFTAIFITFYVSPIHVGKKKIFLSYYKHAPS
jgi:hypothetical protein